MSERDMSERDRSAMSTPGTSQAAAGWFPTADLTAGEPPPTAPMQALPRDDGGRDDRRPDAVPPDDAPPDDLPPDDLLLDAAWDRPAIRNRLTSVLLIAVLVVSGFAGGIAFQRQRGGAASTTAGLPTAGLPGGGAFPGGAFPSGFPGGAQNLPGSGSGASANPSGGSGSPLGGGRSTGADQASPPVVVGTVTAVRSASITVQNFAGKNVTVQVPGTAKVTTPGLTGLSAGATVAVAGTAAADGTVTATAITVTSST